MTDSGSNGWNSNIIGLMQLAETYDVVGTFGGGFTGGSSSGPVYITVLGRYQTQIIITQYGTKTN